MRREVDVKLLLMADKDVGREIACFLLKEFPRDLAAIVTINRNSIFYEARKAGVQVILFQSSQQVVRQLKKSAIDPDLGVLAWWPKIIREPLLSFPRCGFINTHPSLLPYNRGKHPNFWALVEQVPFGVSLHFVDNGIDSGDIIAQRVIDYGWEDNGGSLYVKAQREIVSLFKEIYPVIRTLKIPRQKQNLEQGSFHSANEMDLASKINLDAQYKARDLLNLLRARTFPGHPACWFCDNGEEYEVRIEIRRRSHE